MTRLVKNAAYYQSRLSDLSISQKRKYASLLHQAQSRRILTIPMAQLCEELELEYTKDSFEQNVKYEYAAIGKLLSEFGLKLVPGFIPCDLGFNDIIFVTVKPNMQHDEDCAYVSDLIAKKRPPMPKDMAHITRMNLKLTNYNIILRLFEALGVLGKEHLCTQQRMTLNTIISNLQLPHEGADFLRSCYTYAGEQHNYLCDFYDKEYCFKPLKPEQQENVIKYLALIAAQSTFKPVFSKDYPYLDKLMHEFSLLEEEHNAGIHKYPAFNTLPKVEGVFSQENLKSHLGTGLKAKFSAIYTNLRRLNQDKVIKEHIPEFKQELQATFFANMHLPSWAIAGLKDKVNKASPSFFKAIPKIDEIFFKEARSLISPCREAGFFYWTHNKNIPLAYPWVVDGDADAKRILEDSSLCELKDYLTKPALDDIDQELRLVHSLFFGLIIHNALQGYDPKRSDLLMKMLDAELNKYQYPLLFIKTFYYVLFGIDMKNPSLPKEQVVLGLCCFPSLLSLLIYKIYDFYKEDLDLCPKRLIFYFKLYGIRAVLDNFHLHSVYLQRPLALKLILKLSIALTSSLGDKICDFVTCENDPQGKTLAELAQTAQFTKPYKTLLDQIFSKTLLSPLLTAAFYKQNAPFQFSVNKDFLKKFYALVEPCSIHFDYLLSVNADDNLMLVDLMLNKLSDLSKETLKAKLLNMDFASDEELCRVLSLRWSPELCRSLKHELLKLGLICIPSDNLLPKKLSRHFHHHKFVALKPLKDHVTVKFIEKLQAAQFAYLLFYYAIGKVTFIKELTDFFVTPEDENAFLKGFLDNLAVMATSSKSFLKEQLKEVYASDHSLNYFKDVRECVRFLSRKAVFQFNFNPLLLTRIKDLYAIMHLQERDLISRQNPRLTGIGDKPKKPVFSNLNPELIRSKLQESAQVQDVIAKIRDENDPNATVEISKTNTEVKEIKEEKKEEVKTKIQLPNEAIYKLLHAIYTEGVEIMDLNEFQGLCLSLKFMSMDVAVEEVNDFCYDTFDEPLFDLAPEENQVYITTSLLMQIF